MLDLNKEYREQEYAHNLEKRKSIMKSLKCATYGDGLKIIDVESIFSRGLPGFSIVGLASVDDYLNDIIKLN